MAATRARLLGLMLIRDAWVHLIPCENTNYIEAHINYVEVYAEGNAYLKNQRMAQLEKKLDADKFISIH
jgi:DNA-binding LytR/AlgR family response regulator